MRQPKFRWVLVCLAVLAVPGVAGEGFWPLGQLPLDAMEKDTGFRPDGAWLEKIEKASVRVTRVGQTGGGSGAFVSRQGLVVTNRHVVAEALAGLSTPERNIVEDGFLAATRAEELDCPELEILMPRGSSDVTALVREQFGPGEPLRNVERLTRRLARRMEQPGQRVAIVALHGGAQFWAFRYEVLQVRLVFAPDAKLGRFGGEVDNFEYPRHSLDVAFLRAVRGGAAVESPFVRWSEKGAAEHEWVFMSGHPGTTQRHFTAARLEHLQHAELPVQLAVLKATRAKLEALEARRPELKTAIDAARKRPDNAYKLFSGVCAACAEQKLVEQRTARDMAWLEEFAGEPEARTALQECRKTIAESCKKLAALEAEAFFARGPQLKRLMMAGSLRSFRAALAATPAERAGRTVQSFTAFVKQNLNEGGAERDARVEVDAAVLAGWLSAAQELLPADAPLLRTALQPGESPDAAAQRLLQGSAVLLQRAALLKVLEDGPEAVLALKVPLVEFLGAWEQASAAAPKSAHAELNAACDAAQAAIERLLFEKRGAAKMPEGTTTLRLSWGQVQGYEQAPWATTFAGLLARSAAMGGREPFEVSPKLLGAKETLDLQTPLNFVSTLDGAPGFSGAPVLNRAGELVGVGFDGNRGRITSMYTYGDPARGARSIAVHGRAVLEVLGKVYGAKGVVGEMRE